MVDISENHQKQRLHILDQVLRIVDFQGLSIRLKLQFMLALRIKQQKVYNQHQVMKIIKDKILSTLIQAEDSLLPTGSEKQISLTIMRSLIRELIQQSQLYKFENLTQIIINLYRILLIKQENCQQYKNQVQRWKTDFNIVKNNLNAMKRTDDSFGIVHPYIKQMSNVVAKPCICGQQNFIISEQDQSSEQDTCKRCQRHFHKQCYDTNEKSKFQCRYCCVLNAKASSISEQLFWITLKSNNQGYRNQYYFNLKQSRLRRIKEKFTAQIQVRCLNIKTMQIQWPKEGFSLKINSKLIITINRKEQQRIGIAACNSQQIFMTNSIKIKLYPTKAEYSAYLLAILLIKIDQETKQKHIINEKNQEQAIATPKPKEEKSQEFSFGARNIQDQGWPKQQFENNSMEQFEEIQLAKRDDYQEQNAIQSQPKLMEKFGTNMLKLIEQAFKKQ